MPTNKIILIAFAIGFSFTGFATLAEAKSMKLVTADPQEVAALKSAKITVEQATRIAEKSSGGAATGIAIDNQNGTTFAYDVTVEVVGAEQHVLVDMQNGEVKSGDSADGANGETADTGAEAGGEAAEGPEENEGADEKGGG